MTIASAVKSDANTIDALCYNFIYVSSISLNSKAIIDPMLSLIKFLQ